MTSKNESKRHVAVAIPYYKDGDEIYVMLQRRSKTAKRLPDYFGFFGGGVEEGESAEEGFKREIHEELDVVVSDYEFFGHYEFYGTILDVFIMEVSEDFLESVKILEGQYGKYFSEEEVMNEEKLIDQDKLILKNFFGIQKRGNPYLL